MRQETTIEGKINTLLGSFVNIIIERLERVDRSIKTMTYLEFEGFEDVAIQMGKRYEKHEDHVKSAEYVNVDNNGNKVVQITTGMGYQFQLDTLEDPTTDKQLIENIYTNPLRRVFV